MGRALSRLALCVLAGPGMALAAANAYGAEATAQATATILAPIKLSKTADLSFAAVVPHAADPDVVAVNAAGARSCGPNLTCTGPVSAGRFEITGAPFRAFAVTVPADPRLIAAGADSMAVSGFTAGPGASGALSSDGTAMVAVGAILTVPAGQPAQTYRGSFDVTVNYE